MAMPEQIDRVNFSSEVKCPYCNKNMLRVAITKKHKFKYVNKLELIYSDYMMKSNKTMKKYICEWSCKKEFVLYLENNTHVKKLSEVIV